VRHGEKVSGKQSGIFLQGAFAYLVDIPEQVSYIDRRPGIVQ